MDKKRLWYVKFIKSFAWEKCSESYMASINGLCEECLKAGKITPAEEVHHKIKLTPANVNNPAIALNWSNLEGLCKECHMNKHRKSKRWKVDKDGNVTLEGSPG